MLHGACGRTYVQDDGVKWTTTNWIGAMVLLVILVILY